MNKLTIAISFVVLVFLGVLASGGGADKITKDLSQGAGGLIFSDALRLDGTQLSGVHVTAASIQAEFNDLNTRPTMTPRSGAVTYNGSLLARIGTGEHYLSGSFSVVLDMVSGTGRGRVGAILMSGADVAKPGLQDLTTYLDINITSISGSSMTGTITGEFSDQYAIDRQFSEEFQVDTS